MRNICGHCLRCKVLSQLLLRRGHCSGHVVRPECLCYTCDKRSYDECQQGQVSPQLLRGLRKMQLLLLLLHKGSSLRRGHCSGHIIRIKRLCYTCDKRSYNACQQGQVSPQLLKGFMCVTIVATTVLQHAVPASPAPQSLQRLQRTCRLTQMPLLYL